MDAPTPGAVLLACPDEVARRLEHALAPAGWCLCRDGDAVDFAAAVVCRHTDPGAFLASWRADPATAAVPVLMLTDDDVTGADALLPLDATPAVLRAQVAPARPAGARGAGGRRLAAPACRTCWTSPRSPSRSRTRRAATCSSTAPGSMAFQRRRGRRRWARLSTTSSPPTRPTASPAIISRRMPGGDPVEYEETIAAARRPARLPQEQVRPAQRTAALGGVRHRHGRHAPETGRTGAARLRGAVSLAGRDAACLHLSQGLAGPVHLRQHALLRRAEANARRDPRPPRRGLLPAGAGGEVRARRPARDRLGDGSSSASRNTPRRRAITGTSTSSSRRSTTPTGGVIGMQGIFWDVTDRKRAQDELARNAADVAVARRRAAAAVPLASLAGGAAGGGGGVRRGRRLLPRRGGGRRLLRLLPPGRAGAWRRRWATCRATARPGAADGDHAHVPARLRARRERPRRGADAGQRAARRRRRGRPLRDAAAGAARPAAAARCVTPAPGTRRRTCWTPRQGQARAGQYRRAAGHPSRPARSR